MLERDLKKEMKEERGQMMSICNEKYEQIWIICVKFGALKKNLTLPTGLESQN